MDASRFLTHSLRDPRLLRILSAALEAVDPFRAVQMSLPPLEGRVFGLGIGKAAVPMMDALAAQVPLASGLAVTKFAPEESRELFAVIEGGHPIPDGRSLQAGERVLDFVSSLEEGDTLVCLISGGGSALVTAPRVPLEDLQTLTSLLLASGAPIDEINVLRRQLDRIKGGGLARATRARVLSLILSDVIGNPLEAIASGPTAPDPTTQQDALEILKKYQIEQRAPASIQNFLRTRPAASGATGRNAVDRVQNVIIGDNQRAAQGALKQAQHEGFYSEIIYSALQGEARQLGGILALYLRVAAPLKPKPFCLIAGGETTVKLRGDGKGGRNQELALAALRGLAGFENLMLISLATDGDDGPTDAAGAVVTGESSARAESLGLDPAAYLSRNDAYPFFEALGDLLKTGPTGTNVNDLILLCCL